MAKFCNVCWGNLQEDWTCPRCISRRKKRIQLIVGGISIIAVLILLMQGIYAFQRWQEEWMLKSYATSMEDLLDNSWWKFNQITGSGKSTPLVYVLWQDSQVMGSWSAIERWNALLKLLAHAGYERQQFESLRDKAGFITNGYSTWFLVKNENDNATWSVAVKSNEFNVELNGSWSVVDKTIYSYLYSRSDVTDSKNFYFANNLLLTADFLGDLKMKQGLYLGIIEKNGFFNFFVFDGKKTIFSTFGDYSSYWFENVVIRNSFDIRWKCLQSQEKANDDAWFASRNVSGCDQREMVKKEEIFTAKIEDGVMKVISDNGIPDGNNGIEVDFFNKSIHFEWKKDDYTKEIIVPKIIHGIYYTELVSKARDTDKISVKSYKQ